MPRLTDAGEKAKFWRADVVEVLEASPARVAHFWAPADALKAGSRGRLPVGGAEFGHIDLAEQRRLKAGIFAEQLNAARRRGPRNHRGSCRRMRAPTAWAGGPGPASPWLLAAAWPCTRTVPRTSSRSRKCRWPPPPSMPSSSGTWTSPALTAWRWPLPLPAVRRWSCSFPPPEPIPGPWPGLRPKLAPQRTPVPVKPSPWPPGIPESHELTRLRGRTWVREHAAGHEYRVTGAGFWQIHRSAPASAGERPSCQGLRDPARVNGSPTCSPVPASSPHRWPTPPAPQGTSSPLRVLPAPAGMPARTCSPLPRSK